MFQGYVDTQLQELMSSCKIIRQKSKKGREGEREREREREREGGGGSVRGRYVCMYVCLHSTNLFLPFTEFVEGHKLMVCNF